MSAGAVLCTMRDAIIDRLTEKMRTDERIFFLSADLGAPSLDRLRARYPNRFFNVGIAEQNLVSIATGIALEGGVVFAYGIAPFVSMRALEQIRNDLALLSEFRPLNVNLLALGAGLSYDVSGPTHHCIEDLSMMRALPNIDVLSPSDPVLARQAVDRLVDRPVPAYLRLDSKPLAPLYDDASAPDWDRGFAVHEKGGEVCVVSTGFPVYGCLETVRSLRSEGVEAGMVDLFVLRPFDEAALSAELKAYRHIVSVAESTVGTGGLDALLLFLLNAHHCSAGLTSLGPRSYVFDNGTRTDLQRLVKMDPAVLRDVVLSRHLEAQSNGR